MALSGTAAPEFCILGPLLLKVDDRPVTLGGLKQRAVLILLMLNVNRVVSPARLIDAIWGDRSTKGTYQTLRTYIYHLRRALEPGRRPGRTESALLRTSSAGYKLQIDPEQLDSTRFERLLIEGRKALDEGGHAVAARKLDRALRLWRGPALDEFIEWDFSHAEAHRLEELRLVAVELRISANLALGQTTSLLGELLSLVERHPERDGLRALLMRVLYRSGRSAEALSVYEQGRQLLTDRLGADPGANLQRLHQTILRQEPDLDRTFEPDRNAISTTSEKIAPSLLPLDVGDITGWSEELAEVSSVLLRERGGSRTAVPIVGINGKAGAGKTAFAVHIAHQLAWHYPDGQLFADLRGTEAERLDPSTILAGFLQALHVPGTAIPPTLEERALTYRARLSGRRVLVLLDNAADEAQVRPLLPGNPDCGVLITSRSRLIGLEGVHAVTLNVLDPGSAVELLAKMAGRERVEQEPQEADEIVRLCGYLSLAIRIAGGRLASRPHWRLAVLAERLRDEQKRLGELAIGDLEVRTSFTLSYEGCSRPERRAFRLLGLLRGTNFSAWVVAALLAIERVEAEELCERLLEAQLLELADGDASGPTRYGFHDLLHLFAKERVEAEESPTERQAALERMLGEFLELAMRADDGLRSSSQQAIEWFRTEAANLTVSVVTAYDAGMWALTWRLALTLSLFFEIESRRDDWQRTHTLALTAARRAEDRVAEALVNRSLGDLYLHWVRWDEALASYESCLAVFEALGDRLEEVQTRARIGIVYRRQGRFTEALGCYEHCLPVLRKLGEPREVGHALRHLSKVYHNQGRLDEALSKLQESRLIFERLHDRFSLAVVQRTLGVVHRDRGELDTAMSQLRACLPVFEELGDRYRSAITNRELGVLLRLQGKYDEAAACFDRCLPVFHALGDSEEAYGWLHLGDLRLEEGRVLDAIDHYKRSARVFETGGDRFKQARALMGLVAALAASGDHAAAEATRQKARTIFASLDVPVPAEVHQLLA